MNRAVAVGPVGQGVEGDRVVVSGEIVCCRCGGTAAAPAVCDRPRLRRTEGVARSIVTGWGGYRCDFGENRFSRGDGEGADR